MGLRIPLSPLLPVMKTLTSQDSNPRKSLQALLWKGRAQRRQPSLMTTALPTTQELTSPEGRELDTASRPTASGYDHWRRDTFKDQSMPLQLFLYLTQWLLNTQYLNRRGRKDLSSDEPGAVSTGRWETVGTDLNAFKQARKLNPAPRILGNS